MQVNVHRTTLWTWYFSRKDRLPTNQPRDTTLAGQSGKWWIFWNSNPKREFIFLEEENFLINFSIYSILNATRPTLVKYYLAPTNLFDFKGRPSGEHHIHRRVIADSRTDSGWKIFLKNCEFTSSRWGWEAQLANTGSAAFVLFKNSGREPWLSNVIWAK